MQPVPPESLRVECSHVAVQRQRVWRALDLLGFSQGAVAVLAGTLADRAGLDLVGGRLVAIAAAALVTVVHRVSVGARAGDSTAGVVEFEPGGVRVSTAAGTWELDPLRARQGWVLPLGDASARFVLRFSDGRVLSGVASPEHRARALVDAASLGPSQRSLRVSLASLIDRAPGRQRWISLFNGFAMGWAVLLFDAVRLGAWDFALQLLAGGAVAFALAFALGTRPRVTVGSDGVEIAKTFAREFVPYARVESLAMEPRGVALTLRGGDSVALATGSSAFDQRREPGIAGSAYALCDVLYERIQSAMTVARRDAAPATPVHARLDRQGRSLPEWQSDLQVLGEMLPGYRDEAVTPADLLRVLSDPAASAERRLGAAIALLAGESAGEMRVRVERAADTTARGALRDALRAVARGEVRETVLERALAA